MTEHPANPPLRLGQAIAIGASSKPVPFTLATHHLVTHGVVVGMTGSGKTGLLTVMIEETIGAGIPVLIVDVKGDLPNLLLAFPSFDPVLLRPWAESTRGPMDTRTTDEIATALSEERRIGLTGWGIDETALRAWHDRTSVRVFTPGATAGESLHLLSSLERRSTRWDTDLESARATLSAAVSLVLRLLGRDPDPTKSREHVLLSVLAELHLIAGKAAQLSTLLADVLDPPIEEIGALPIDQFVSKADRKALAAALNTLLASPTFASWRQGATIDVGEWQNTCGNR